MQLGPLFSPACAHAAVRRPLPEREQPHAVVQYCFSRALKRHAQGHAEQYIKACFGILYAGRSVIVYTRAVLSNKTADMRCRRKRDVFGAERDPASDLEFNLEGIRRSFTRRLKECAFIVDPGPIRGHYTNVAADEEASHASDRSVEPDPHIDTGIVSLLFVCSFIEHVILAHIPAHDAQMVDQ